MSKRFMYDRHMIRYLVPPNPQELGNIVTVIILVLQLKKVRDGESKARTIDESKIQARIWLQICVLRQYFIAGMRSFYVRCIFKSET